MDDEWAVGMAAYEAARVAFETISTSIAERLRAGEMPTEAEVQREQKARTELLVARRAVLLRFAATRA